MLWDGMGWDHGLTDAFPGSPGSREEAQAEALLPHWPDRLNCLRHASSLMAFLMPDAMVYRVHAPSTEPHPTGSQGAQRTPCCVKV